MVEPSWLKRVARLLTLAGVSLLAGCSFVPRARFDELHKHSQALQARNSQLKDENLSLKSQYEDLAQRADDDARRLKFKDEENRRLTASVQAYQEERERFAAEFERIKRLARGSTAGADTAVTGP
jgi:chemotaxis protein MotB